MAARRQLLDTCVDPILYSEHINIGVICSKISISYRPTCCPGVYPSPCFVWVASPLAGIRLGARCHPSDCQEAVRSQRAQEGRRKPSPHSFRSGALRKGLDALPQVSMLLLTPVSLSAAESFCREFPGVNFALQ